MKVKDVKAIARQWVIEEGIKTSDFFGAYLTGSINHFSDDAEFPVSSDVDIAVILSRPHPEKKPTKFIHHGVILEASYTPFDEVGSPEQVLGNYHRAGAFRTPNILSDPTGQLTKLQKSVAKDFANRCWVRRRCGDAINNTRRFLDAVNTAELYHDQVTCWLFGTAGPCHILLTAGLRNPTVRRRYLETRKLLDDYDHTELHESLLELQGSAQLTRERVEYHLGAMTKVFDFAKTIIKTPYRFTSDISDVGRPISIGGSWEFIESRFHREAVYWIVATYSRCLAILDNDAPQDIQNEYAQGFHELLADLGIGSFSDLQQRTEITRTALAQVWNVADAIMTSNPAVTD
jgi:hypothetical protein